MWKKLKFSLCFFCWVSDPFNPHNIIQNNNFAPSQVPGIFLQQNNQQNDSCSITSNYSSRAPSVSSQYSYYQSSTTLASPGGQYSFGTPTASDTNTNRCIYFTIFFRIKICHLSLYLMKKHLLTPHIKKKEY